MQNILRHIVIKLKVIAKQNITAENSTMTNVPYRTRHARTNTRTTKRANHLKFVNSKLLFQKSS